MTAQSLSPVGRVASLLAAAAGTPISRAVLVTLLAGLGSASAADTLVPLEPREELATFYIDVGVAGAGPESYLVDTGAGYMTITDATLAGRPAGHFVVLTDFNERSAKVAVADPLQQLHERGRLGCGRLRPVRRRRRGGLVSHGR